jgi:hypothetical protein
LATAKIGTLFWNFTGQHRCFVLGYTAKTMAQIEGLVVCANQNRYVTTNATTGDFTFLTGAKAITTNDALPVVALSSKANDKTVFGVVSLTTEYAPSSGGRALDPTADQLASAVLDGDQRAEINALGEGAMWVCDANGPIESGDFIATSQVPGYGMQQSNPCMCNYTVAKATMDCDFTAPLIPVTALRVDQFGNNVTDSTGMPIYDPVLTSEGQEETAPAYNRRFLLLDGTQITEEAYAAAVAAGTPAFRAAFVGVTLHAA